MKKYFEINSLLIVIFLTITTISISAQPWLKNVPDTANFYTKVNSFNQYWEGRTIEKGKGWKQFKRWENFWKPRVYPTGKINHKALWKATIQKNTTLANKDAQAANWVALGPNETPAQLLGNNKLRGNGRVNCVAFHPKNELIMYVGSPSGGIWRTTDGGNTWQTTTDNLPSIGISDIAIHPAHPDTILAGTGDRDAGDTYSHGLIISYDGGQTWQTTNLAHEITNLTTINMVLIHPDSNNIVLVATNGGIYRSEDFCETWTKSISGDFKDIKFQPNNPQKVYASRFSHGGGAVYISNNNGRTFSTVNFGSVSINQANRIAIAVTPADSNVVYLLSSRSSDNGFHSLVKSEDAGETWIETYSSDIKNLLGWQTDGSDFGGQGWYDLAIAASPIDADIVFVGGVNIWKSTDGGYSFDINAYWNGSGNDYDYVHADQHMFKYNNQTGVLFSCNDGGFHKTENGTDWDWISNHLQITQIYRMGASYTNSGRCLIGTQDNGTFRYNDSTWHAVMGGDGMECIVDYTNESTMYAETYYGNISKSTLGGYYWESITPNQAGQGDWVTPYILHPHDNNTLYAGYSSIFKTENQGDSWTAISPALVSGYYLFTSLAVAESNDNYIYASSINNIYRTKNGGDTWESIKAGLPNQAMTYIAVSAYNPEELWVTFSGYNENNKVFYSKDAGNTWQNISDGLPNVPANCVCYEKGSNDGIYLGTDIGIYYTNNKLNGWVDFSNGLPNVIVNELEIHYPTRKIRAATYGRGLWESNCYYENAAPEAEFSFIYKHGCSGIVDFQNNTNNYMDTIIWSFGDGTQIEDVLSPSHQYIQNGNYYVQLIVKNTQGVDTIGDTVSISILTPPVNVPDTLVTCENSEIEIVVDTDNTTYWFDANNADANPIFIGDTLIYDISQTTTIYVANGVDSTCFSEFIPIYLIANSTPEAQMLYSVSGDYVYFFTNNSENADSCKWIFGDGEISTSDTVTHKYDHSGTYTIFFIAYNNCGTDTSSITFTIQYENIKEINQNKNLIIKPNPYTEYADIEINTNIDKSKEIQIVNNLGQVVKSFKLASNEQVVRLQKNDIEAGIYSIVLIVENKIAGAKKIIHKK